MRARSPRRISDLATVALRSPTSKSSTEHLQCITMAALRSTVVVVTESGVRVWVRVGMCISMCVCVRACVCVWICMCACVGVSVCES